MGCGVPKEWPDELDFVASVGGSCPEAFNATVSGTAVHGVKPTCLELEEADPPRCTNCSCLYTWEIDPGDIPVCGPYVGTVYLECGLQIAGEDDIPVLGAISGCDHLRYEKYYWHAVILVHRADTLRRSPPPCEQCPIEEPCATYYPVQLGDCTWDCQQVAEPDNGGCNLACPPCYDCHACGPSDDICCGVDGCEECEVTETCPANICVDCWHYLSGTSGPIDPSCDNYCPLNDVYSRIYEWYPTNCVDPNLIEGCNPVSCPPDPANTGDFYLMYGCGDEDFIEWFCPAAE
jgi:hypothetical protein